MDLPPPPRDARADAARIAQARRMEQNQTFDVASVIAQALLALVGGGWAASASAPAWPEALVYGAVGLSFALGLAWGAVSTLRLLGVLLILPRLIRLLVARPAPAQWEETRGDRVMIVATWLIHTAVLACSAAALSVLLWLIGDDVALVPTLLRFLAVVAGLSLLTYRAERVFY